MSMFGSMLGGILSMAGLFLSIYLTFTITNAYLVFLLFPLFGIIGGISLGALNSRKGRTQARYRNEYTVYASMFFAAIVFLGLYYFIFDMDVVTNNLKIDTFTAPVVVVMAMVSGIVMELGLGLATANMLADGSSRY